ncbi:MAG TPA: hypothetical protein VJZ05_01275 [Bacilli bacterium]|nr:hypothetical protein [Bacilli bacterium]
MNKHQKRIFQLRIKLGLTFVSLAVALTSLVYVTYSWFMFNRNASIGGLDVGIEQIVTHQLKYFVGNGDEGYPSSDFSSTDVDVSVDDYASDFVPVSSDFHQYQLSIKQPSYRLTFALELSLSASDVARTYEIKINGFTSESATNYYNVATNQLINIAEAVNIYSTIINGDADNTTITSNAAAFVSADAPAEGDKFDGTDEYATLNSFSFDASVVPQKRIFLFTINFSDDPATYYNFHSYAGDNLYFEKSPLGNSNVYQGLIFRLDALLISRTN